MGSYVVKVQHNGSIRRLTLAKGEREFSYEQLQSRIRDLYQLPRFDEFVLTYIDKEEDVVTMGDDEDLRDALVLQGLNPLRVTIANVQGGTDVKTSSPILKQEDSNEVTEQQQSVQGEQTPPQLSKSVSAERIAEAEPVMNSGDKVPIVEPVTNSGESSAAAEDSDPAHAALPAATGPVGDAKEASQEEAKVLKTKIQEAEGCTEIHYGVKCDGCGMHPISGPRFKSCRRLNYDLCLDCLNPTGLATGIKQNESGNIEGDNPYPFYRVILPAGRIGRRHSHHRMWANTKQSPNSTVEPNSTSTAAAAPPADAAAEAKTTTEEKSGANSPRVFHQGVQCDECGIVPIEGPRYKSITAFNYDLCRTCFERSGSNTLEYARLDYPVGHSVYPAMMQLVRRGSPRCRPQYRPNVVGPRWLWALSQMVPIIALDDGSKSEVEETVPAATPPAKADSVDSAPATKQEEATEERPVDAKVESKAVQIPVDSPPAPKQEVATEERPVDAEVESKAVQIPVTNTKEGDSAAASSPEAQTPAVEIGNASTEENNSGTTAGVAAPVEAAAEGDLSTLEDLLSKLAAMGFEDAKLNAELLEKNSFDLRKALDDLCAAEEWDPILGELQEMGFYDANLNRRLMFKNNGSVKRVVKELVQMYKGETKA